MASLGQYQKDGKGAAPISEIVAIHNWEQIDFELSLSVNGEIKQHGSTKNMERSILELITYVHAVFQLRKGDAIFTGTPEGVGNVQPNDVIVATLHSYVSLEVEMA